MKTKTKVIVVGGGVVGVSTLYHLAKKGWSDVVLVERKELTSGSTWHAAGLLPLFNMSYSVGQLHKYAVNFYKTLEEETGQNVGFSVVSNIRLATTQDRMDEYHQYAGVAKTIGVNVKFLTPEDVKEIWPLCNTEGPENAENTIIEFLDYFCGYCKKIHPELMKLVKTRNDTRVIFLQYPILSESSKVIAEMVIAATYQNKGLEFHDELFSIKGSINQEKLEQVINKVGIDILKLRTDITKDEIKNIVRLSSFLASGAGARGTPTFFINEEFVPGYISSQQIKSLLK